MGDLVCVSHWGSNIDLFIYFCFSKAPLPYFISNLDLRQFLLGESCVYSEALHKCGFVCPFGDVTFCMFCSLFWQSSLSFLIPAFVSVYMPTDSGACQFSVCAFCCKQDKLLNLWGRLDSKDHSRDNDYFTVWISHITLNAMHLKSHALQSYLFVKHVSSLILYGTWSCG